MWTKTRLSSVEQSDLDTFVFARKLFHRKITEEIRKQHYNVLLCFDRQPMSLDPGQAGQIVGPDPCPNCYNCSNGILAVFLKKIDIETS